MDSKLQSIDLKLQQKKNPETKLQFSLFEDTQFTSETLPEAV